MKTSATRAAIRTPAALYKAAKTLEWRSGGIACKASSNTANTVRPPPTTSGRGQARQNMIVSAKYPAKWSISQPSPERGCHRPGPRPITRKKIAAATQLTFNRRLKLIRCRSISIVPPYVTRIVWASANLHRADCAQQTAGCGPDPGQHRSMDRDEEDKARGINLQARKQGVPPTALVRY